MDHEQRQALIDRYREGYAAVEEALRGASDAALDARPAPGEFTAREVVHHLADSEMTSAIRLRRLIAEDAPHIQAYDENQFARALYYDRRPTHASLAAMKAARDTSAQILDLLGEDDWTRSGTHSDSGAYSVETWLHVYAAHAHDHARQIREALTSAGQ
ncbi:MAG: DinB family protein [Chloroflexi bacterium]|nr:DinB family protein [Chloroflexota bacterium]